MKDTIYRQDAIDAIDKIGSLDTDADREYARSVFESLPSAQPERKSGKWVVDETGLIVTSYTCSECGRKVRDDTGYDVYADYPYCHCGAKMEEEQDESDRKTN